MRTPAWLALADRIGVEAVLRRTANRLELSRRERALRIAPVQSPALVILAYHRVLRAQDAYLPGMPEPDFERQMTRLAGSFRVIPLIDAVERLERNELPHDAVALTFDDGYRDNYDVAWPILRELGLPATIFLTTGAIDRARPLWYDRVFRSFHLTTRSSLVDSEGEIPTVTWSSNTSRTRARDRVLEWLKASDDATRKRAIDRIEIVLDTGPPPRDGHPMLDWDQIREMHRNGIDFGAHTIDHPILTRVDRRRARQEIVGSRDRIRAVLGASPGAFAYPNGQPNDFDEGVCALVEAAGFRCAVTTVFGANPSGTDSRPVNPFALHRCGIVDPDPTRFALRLSWYRLTLGNRRGWSAA